MYFGASYVFNDILITYKKKSNRNIIKIENWFGGGYIWEKLKVGSVNFLNGVFCENKKLRNIFIK